MQRGTRRATRTTMPSTNTPATAGTDEIRRAPIARASRKRDHRQVEQRRHDRVNARSPLEDRVVEHPRRDLLRRAPEWLCGDCRGPRCSQAQSLEDGPGRSPTRIRSAVSDAQPKPPVRRTGGFAGTPSRSSCTGSSSTGRRALDPRAVPVLVRLRRGEVLSVLMGAGIVVLGVRHRRADRRRAHAAPRLARGARLRAGPASDRGAVHLRLHRRWRGDRLLHRRGRRLPAAHDRDPRTASRP